MAHPAPTLPPVPVLQAGHVQHLGAVSPAAAGPSSLNSATRPLQPSASTAEEAISTVEGHGVDQWLGSIALATYATAVIEYGYDSMKALHAASEEEITEMTQDVDIGMKKPHRALLVKEWKKLTALAQGSEKRTDQRMSTPPTVDDLDGIFDDPIAFAEEDNDWLRHTPDKNACTRKCRSIKYFAPGSHENGTKLNDLFNRQGKRDYYERWKSLINSGEVKEHGLITYRDREGRLILKGQTLCIQEIKPSGERLSRKSEAKGGNGGRKRALDVNGEAANGEQSKKQKQHEIALGNPSKELLGPQNQEQDQEEDVMEEEVGEGEGDAGAVGTNKRAKTAKGAGDIDNDTESDEEPEKNEDGVRAGVAGGAGRFDDGAVAAGEGVAGVGRRDAGGGHGMASELAGPAPKWYDNCEESEDENAVCDYHFSDFDDAKSISSDEEQAVLEAEILSDDEEEEEGEDEWAKSMETLASLGFCHMQQNEELLSKYCNNLDHVINELYSMQEQGQSEGKRAGWGGSGGGAVEVETDRDASPGAAVQPDDTVGLHDAYMSCLPESVKISVNKFDKFQFAVLPVSATGLSETYQDEVAKFFKGETVGFEEHNWSDQLDSLLQTRQPRKDGRTLSSVLSVWQAVGYKHAQRILSLKQTDLKGCLFWWTPGSGKSIMVALLIELLQATGKKIIVVSTPQNIKQNSLKECVKSLLRFSPMKRRRYGSVTDIPNSEIKVVLQQLRGSILCKDFYSFQKFYTQYKGKDISDKCLIIDECHELFDNKLKNRDEIYELVSSAQKVFTLSGTPWRNTNEMERQLELLHTDMMSIPSSPVEDKLRALAAGCVSYVDGTQDRSNFPIDGGWRVERCCISENQMYNFSTRCHQQLSNFKDHGGESKLQNVCQVAEKLTHDSSKLSQSQCRQVYAVCRTMQCAGGAYWGSPSSGLSKILKSSPCLSSVRKFAPKFEKLCNAVQTPADALNTKHFVYSSYKTTITHLGQTLDALKSDAANPIFKQLYADDFEWHGQALRFKSSLCTHKDSIVFVNLKGKLEDRKKLMAAFGYVTPGGERFEGLGRPGNEKVPLVQMMLGCRESNQGLTLLRLQHIHILEPNPKGWGQIEQTIGRGIRRGTHEGVSDKQLRTVTSTIYITTIQEKWVDNMKRTQLDQVLSKLKLQLSECHVRYNNLKKLAIDCDMVADPTKTYLNDVENQRKKLMKNLGTLTKNIYRLFSDKHKLEGGWLSLPMPGKMSHKDSSPKKTMVRMWDILPDEAIFKIIWGEEESRIKFDEIIRASAVDALLLKDFHTDMGRRGWGEEKSAQLRERFEKALAQSFDDLEKVPMIGKKISSFPCSICGNKSSAGSKSSGSTGVKCQEDHFVCSNCYLSLYMDTSDLSIKDAHQHHLQNCIETGLVECCASSCFASFNILQPKQLKFPLYWKIKDSTHFKVVNNQFMQERIQNLIQLSVRSKCGEGCKGVDGDGTGTASASVTKVLRIENGTLWKNYWEKKNKMIAAGKSSPMQRLTAKNMELAKLFPRVQLNEDINELFLFHGTKELAAQSIAEFGFDPKLGKGLYGAGCYCADYSCKAMQYAGGRNQAPDQQRIFLISRVLMGEAYQTRTRLCDIKDPPGKCDSVFAGEGKADDEKQQHNEYIIYDSDQMYPEYLVYVKVGVVISSSDDLDFGAALDWMFSINERAAVKEATASGSKSTWALDSDIVDGPPLSEEEIHEQKTFGSQSRRGRSEPDDFGHKVSSDAHASSCFEKMLVNEELLSGEWAVFYHSYSHAALIYEVQVLRRVKHVLLVFLVDECDICSLTYVCVI